MFQNNHSSYDANPNWEIVPSRLTSRHDLSVCLENSKLKILPTQHFNPIRCLPTQSLSIASRSLRPPNHYLQTPFPSLSTVCNPSLSIASRFRETSLIANTLSLSLHRRHPLTAHYLSICDSGLWFFFGLYSIQSLKVVPLSHFFVWFKFYSYENTHFVLTGTPNFTSVLSYLTMILKIICFTYVGVLFVNEFVVFTIIYGLFKFVVIYFILFLIF